MYTWIPALQGYIFKFWKLLGYRALLQTRTVNSQPDRMATLFCFEQDIDFDRWG